MSTLRDERETLDGIEIEPDDEPLGYREFEVRLPDGTIGLDQIQLTPDDLLFPEEDDRHLQIPEHSTDVAVILRAFFSRLNNFPDSYAVYDYRVDFNIPGVRPLGPDLIFFQCREPGPDETLNIARDGAQVHAIIEVTSRATRSNDFGIKKDVYEQAGVPIYIIVDGVGRKKARKIRLHGFRNGPSGFTPIVPDPEGRVLIDSLGILLGVEGPQVSCFDAATGQKYLPMKEVDHALKLAQADAERSEREAAEARARIEQSERESVEARARIEQSERETAEAHARIERSEREAAEANARAEADAIRVAEMQLKYDLMEAELRRLRGEG